VVESRPVAIVTGASSGIGLAIARRLADAGHDLVLTGRREAPLADAAASLACKCEIVIGDAGDPAVAAAMIDAAVTRLGGLDVLVLNAGWAEVVPIPETTPDVMRRAFDVNVFGPAEAIRLAWPTLCARGGRIIGISSYASLDPFPGFFAYGATKAALNLLMRDAATEGAESGVRAFAVAPGAVETPLLRSAFDTDMLPESTCLAPDDVAELAMQCITGRRDADNGKAIYIIRADDGGVQTMVA
jgi:meso-butanediol dehydrogenase/(S,S)-butanediol dehydrogenase/diacetyl reductase